ncbi:MAG: alpha/beta hydrolase [Pseudomonadota bacterium]
MTSTRTPGLAALAVLVALSACSNSNPPYPRGSLDKLYPQPPRPELLTVTVEGRSLQTARMSGSGSTPLLFVHGSPGDWQAWARYLDATRLADYNPRIAVDRPGFGGSGAGKVIPDLRQQAKLIAGLIQPGAQAVVVGHSLGGPLVGWLLLDYPEKFCGGVMVAGSIAPELESPRWYNRLAQTWIAHWLAPREMLWSNTEILALQGELEKLEPEWPRLQRKIIVVQGETDELVDPRTADYAEARIPTAWREVRRIPKVGHFMLWQQPETVMDAIESLGCGATSAPPQAESAG